MTEEQAYKKALEIVELLGLNLMTVHSDGTTTTTVRKQEKEVDITAIMNVLMK